MKYLTHITVSASTAKNIYPHIPSAACECKLYYDQLDVDDLSWLRLT